QAIAAAIGLKTSADTFNPVVVDFYRQVGYLPDAIINYLVLLGWSLDDKTEFFTRQQMIELFSLERVNKGPASFDPKKLFAFQEPLRPEAAGAAEGGEAPAVPAEGRPDGGTAAGHPGRAGRRRTPQGGRR